METDPASLDPEERFNKLLALFSAAVGVLSLCAGLIPICGASLGLLGIVAGFFGRRSESRQMATAGTGLSILGLMISITYFLFLALRLNSS